jgi:hypothetical protein
VDALIEKAVEKGERDDITGVLMELPSGRKESTSDTDVTQPVVLPVAPKNRPFRLWLWVLLALVGSLTFIALFLLWLRIP